MKHKAIAAFLFVVAALPGAHGAAHASRAIVEAGLLGSPTPIPVIVHLDRGSGFVAPGLRVVYRFRGVPAVYGFADGAAIEGIARTPGVTFVEADKPIEFDLDNATVVSKARRVWDPIDGSAPVRDDQGRVVDGKGIGIAIVDTGLDGLHPDYQVPGKVGGNWDVMPAGVLVPSPYTSSTSEGHGTHVAGIAAGLGTASGGKYRGAAPGATLFAFNMYAHSIIFPAVAFDWILQHGAEQNPPIRVVNNSWHCITQACAHQVPDRYVHMQLARELTKKGIVVTWAAGNLEGDGVTPTTNIEGRDPTPGIISVANYKDDNLPTRDRCLSSSSSWGAALDPTTWPDVAAPGRGIVSTWAAGPYIGESAARNPVTGENTYRELTGTSMAAPHAAGVAALMMQVAPKLSPASIEYILKSTATPLNGPGNLPGCGIDYLRADPMHPWNGANYAAGHGLIDAVAAVEAARTFDSIPPLVQPETIPDSFEPEVPAVAVEETFYLSGDSALSTTFPTGAPRVRPMVPGAPPVVHTSEPFVTPLTADAVKVDLYLGSTSEFGEAAGSYIGYALIEAAVERISAGGDVETIGLPFSRNDGYRIMQPVQREYAIYLDEPVTFVPGDRVRVTISYTPRPYNGTPANSAWDLFSEGTTPARIGLGHRDPHPQPGSFEACDARQDCAMVDAVHPYEGEICGEGPVHLEWSGPPGSSLIFGCDSAVYICPIPPGGGEIGTCKLDTPMSSSRDLSAYCTYVMPDGATVSGRGVCVSDPPFTY